MAMKIQGRSSALAKVTCQRRLSGSACISDLIIELEDKAVAAKGTISYSSACLKFEGANCSSLILKPLGRGGLRHCFR
ncbi:hypothetical protein AMTR_s00088p00135400 [Amborella trichopoda]|uniref:Uncharacterized protein n=1 Tax=Amborella trichopoda TaxID=13333 RepID=W1NVE6_AMBTC|nr:hypothetical protein AMTR_s00088p00135400 [Amborella trichopoda]